MEAQRFANAAKMGSTAPTLPIAISLVTSLVVGCELRPSADTHPELSSATDTTEAGSNDGDDDGDADDTAPSSSDANDGDSVDSGSVDGNSGENDSGDAGDDDFGTSMGQGGGTSGGDDNDDTATSGLDTGADSGTRDDVPDNAFCFDVASWPDASATLEVQILEIVNQRRAEGADCGSEGSFGPAGPLTMNPALRCAARVHSKQMVIDGFFAHTTPDGQTPWDRMAAAGYSFSTAGENIAGGNATAAATMVQWMDSDGHCANIMNPDFEEIGVGFYQGGQWGYDWTQTFGAP